MKTLSKKKLISEIKNRIAEEGFSFKISSCPAVLLESASAGKAKKSDLINAAVAAEFFYQALYNHYARGQGVGADIIMGDYFGSLAIIFAAKIKDATVLRVFCEAIQAATNDEEGEHNEAARLAKIYGASAYTGAYLAGTRGSELDNIYRRGERRGLELLIEG